MKKSILSLVLVFCLVVCIFPLSGNAQTTEAAAPVKSPQTFEIHMDNVTARPCYYALQGSYFMALPALDKGLTEILAGSWYPMAAFEDVLDNPHNYNFGKSLYAVGQVPGEQAGDGLLFGIQNMVPGRYNLVFGANSSFELEQLRIVGQNEKLITAASAPQNPDSPYLGYSQGDRDIILTAFEAGYFSTPFYGTCMPLLGKNETVVSVRGYNITSADITGGTLKNENGETKATLQTIIPASKSDNGLIELYLVFKPLTGALPQDYYETFTLELSTAGDVSCEAMDELNFYSSNWNLFRIDYSDIANRKFAIVTEAPGESLPDKLIVTPSRMDYELQQFVPITSPLEGVRSGGRYVFTLPEKAFLFDESFYLTFSLNGAEGAVHFSTYNIGCHIYFEQYGSTFIDGLTFMVYDPVSGRYNAEGASYTLADANFAPVSGVTITEDTKYLPININRHVFSAQNPLAQGATYYILMGSLPIYKFTTKALDPKDESISKAGSLSKDIVTDGDFDIYLTQFAYKGEEEFRFNISADLYDSIDPSEWSVRLIPQIDSGMSYNLDTENSNPKLTYTPYDSLFGGFSCSLDEINIGPYEVELYRNGVKQTNEKLESELFLCHPARTQTYIEPEDMYSKPFFISSHYLNYIGRMPAPSSVSGWKLAAYKLDGVFVDYNPITVSLPDLVLENGTNKFSLDIPASALKAAGITAGEWFIAMTDNSGKLVKTQILRLTSKFLNSSPEVLRTISGEVFFEGTPVPEVTVELWKDDVRLQTTTTSGAGNYSFTSLAAGEYFIKVPKGEGFGSGVSWVNLPETNYNIEVNVNIWLYAAVPPEVYDIYLNGGTIEVLFTKEMDDSIKNNIKVQTGGINIPGKWEWMDVPILIFTPDEPFAPGSTVTVTVPGTSLDLEGIPLGKDTIKSFNIPRVFENAKISSPVTTIVSGYSATIPFKIENMPKDTACVILMDPNGDIVKEIDGTFGTFTLSNAVFGTYFLLLLEDGAYNGKYCAIHSVGPPTDLWKPLLIPAGDTFQIAFATDIQLKDASLTVGGAKITDFTCAGQLVTVNAPASGSVVLSGVKFPSLFPNYKFTFTLTP